MFLIVFGCSTLLNTYLVVTSIYDYVYSIDMNNVAAFQYDKSDNSVTIWF